jgi:hypothetical protein
MLALAIGLMLTKTPAGSAAAYCRAQPFDAEALGYFVGNYDVIGRDARTGQPFTGSGRFSLSKSLEVQWLGRSGPVSGTAWIELCGADAIPILRIAFREAGTEFDGQCRFQSELDNYARVTCRVAARGLPNSTEGLLAFFFRPVSSS